MSTATEMEQLVARAVMMISKFNFRTLGELEEVIAAVANAAYEIGRTEEAEIRSEEFK